MRGSTDLQTKMMVVQVLFDLYKVITIELHRKVSANYTKSDFFNRCPCCLNGSLMRSEYWAMVDSIRECLPLQNRMNGDYVTLEHDPLRHKHINGNQLKFIDVCSSKGCSKYEQRKFHSADDLGRYGLRLDLERTPFLKYDTSNKSINQQLKCRSVSNVLNCRPRSSSTIAFSLLSDIDPGDETILEINSIMRLLNKSSMSMDGSHHLIEMMCLKNLLNGARSYYPFRITHWDDFSKCRVSSYFISIRDESRYQAADTSGTFAQNNNNRMGESRLNEDNDFEFRQNMHAAQFDGEMMDNDEGMADYRQQFDAISKDFISSERQHFDPPQNGSFYQWLTMRSMIDTIQQKWWSLFGKYWIVKNDKNDDDIKKMKWLMTGGNHDTMDVCGENASLHCDEMYFNASNVNLCDKNECVGTGRLQVYLLNRNQSKLLKLELGCQLPVKRQFKLKSDLVKALRKNDWGARGGSSSNVDNLCYWMNKKHTIVREHWDPGSMEFSLPNSRTGFFDKCVTQYIYL